MQKKPIGVQKEELRHYADHVVSTNCIDLAQPKLMDLCAPPRPRAGLAFHLVNCIAATCQPKQAPMVFHLYDEFLPRAHKPEALEHTLTCLANMCVRVGWDQGYFRCFFRASQLRRAGLVSPRFTIMPVSYAYLRKCGYVTWGTRI